MFELIPMYEDMNMSLYQYKTEYSSGIDIRAYVPEGCWLYPNKRAAIPTGLKCKFYSKDFEAQVRSRGGLALEHGIFVLNSPGTVDADYDGEIMVILANIGSEPFLIEHMDRIAQLVIAPVERINRYRSNGIRGEGRFSSTGIK